MYNLTYLHIQTANMRPNYTPINTINMNMRPSPDFIASQFIVINNTITPVKFIPNNIIFTACRYLYNISMMLAYCLYQTIHMMTMWILNLKIKYILIVGAFIILNLITIAAIRGLKEENNPHNKFTRDRITHDTHKWDSDDDEDNEEIVAIGINEYDDDSSSSVDEYDDDDSSSDYDPQYYNTVLKKDTTN